MIISFKRTGGVAGMIIDVEIDSDALSSQEAREIDALVDASGLFNLRGGFTAKNAGADGFQYRVSVKDGGREQMVTMDDECAPAAMMPLLRRLTLLARSIMAK